MFLPVSETPGRGWPDRSACSEGYLQRGTKPTVEGGKYNHAMLRVRSPISALHGLSPPVKDSSVLAAGGIANAFIDGSSSTITARPG